MTSCLPHALADRSSTCLLPDFLGEVARRASLRRHEGVRQFVVQHLYPDTLRLLLASHRYVPISTVIGIGYSGNPEVAATLRREGIRVELPSRLEMEAVIRRELGRCLIEAQRDGVQLILHEVGGTAFRILHDEYAALIDQVRGAVEITKQGVWEARKLSRLLVPQWNCAETRLKQLEGPFVGEAVVVAIDNILRECGFCLAGREALVLGYGWVGRGICDGLRKRGMTVKVSDSDALQQVALTLDGFPLCGPNLSALRLVVGATGVRSIDAEVLQRLPHRTMIASGSSKCVEIDVDWLEAHSVAREKVHRHLEAFTLHDGRILYLFHDGYPVNFTGSSVQDEIVEFLFAEALLLLDLAASQTDVAPGIYPLPPEREQLPAKVWLELR
jgi:adenosylhomocysteinase